MSILIQHPASKPPVRLPIFREIACGDCTACCTVMAVGELGKPFYAKCEHVRDVVSGDCGGCSCYASRPPNCRDFQCLYVVGLLGSNEARRPDRCGFVLSIGEEFGQRWLEVYEAKEDIDTADIERLNFLIGKIESRTSGLFHGIRYHYWGAKIGVPFEIRDPYPQGTFNIGNRYMRDDAEPQIIYHVRQGNAPMESAPPDGKVTGAAR